MKAQSEETIRISETLEMSSTYWENLHQSAVRKVGGSCALHWGLLVFSFLAQVMLVPLSTESSVLSNVYLSERINDKIIESLP